MRLNRAVWGVLFTVLLMTVRPAGAGQGIETTILGLEAQRIQAMIAGDLATLDHLLANDLTYVHSNGQMETKEIYLARIKSGDLKYRTVRCKDVRVLVAGNAAVVTGQAAMEVHSKADDLSLLVRFTDVYVDRHGRWEMIAWQSTRIP